MQTDSRLLFHLLDDLISTETKAIGNMNGTRPGMGGAMIEWQGVVTNCFAMRRMRHYPPSLLREAF